MTPIELFRVNMAPEAGAAVARVLSSGYVGEGVVVKQFERELARVLGFPEHGPLSMISCSAALELALRLIGVGPGDEVISSPITCSATSGAIVNRGACIVWADVDPITGNIDPSSVARMMGPRVKAVVAVDWGGRACEYRMLRRAVRVHDNAQAVPIVQDAAHRLYPSDPHADYSCFSYGPIKHLTTGGYGGSILPPEHQRARAKLLRWHGLDRESSEDFRCAQDIKAAGRHEHLTDDHAAVGLANLPYAEASVSLARANALWYTRALGGVPGITLAPFDSTCDYWLFTLLTDDRDGLKAYLAEHGIASSQVHARNDHHTAFKVATARSDALLGVDRFDAHQLSIPCGFWIGPAEREAVAGAVIEFASQRVATGVGV